MCTHHSQCPPADRSDRTAARIVSAHPEQGWNLLCNGVVLFDDGGYLLRKPARSSQSSHSVSTVLAAA